jgi:hypothetical protein
LGPNGGSRNCSEPNGAPGFAQPNGGFTGLTVGARELTHRIALCKTFIYFIYNSLDRTTVLEMLGKNDF